MTNQKNKPHILQWVALWFLAVLLSALVYNAAHAQPSQVVECRSKLTEQVNSSYMSRATANRIALRICREWRDGGGERSQFFRAFVR